MSSSYDDFERQAARRRVSAAEALRATPSVTRTRDAEMRAVATEDILTGDVVRVRIDSRTGETTVERWRG